MTEETTNEELVELLDAEARTLLRRLGEEASLGGEARLSVMDHVRGFAAVTNYVETRLRLAPPKAAKSRIEEMRERIESPRRRPPRANGRAPGSGGSSGEAAPAPLGGPDPPPPI